MAEQIDWVGFDAAKKAKAFKDIRNTQDQVAKRKAELCESILLRCNNVHDTLRSGGTINQIRAWKWDREVALKIRSNKRSSVGDLESALNMMEKHK